jgi:hypothetical protein
LKQLSVDCCEHGDPAINPAKGVGCREGLYFRKKNVYGLSVGAEVSAPGKGWSMLRLTEGYAHGEEIPSVRHSFSKAG